ncbi:hypothetical protein OHB01_28410 [Microbispora hainanensis]|uniref:hypothetical protein n=1 Tax=Microbispora hainanensis TaxID=568844 RepID=UPI002E288BA9|nr:hypothetical protein [Microbispora hainanensis]
MRLSADFAADRSGTAELAWGQRDIWEAIQKVGPDSAHYFNVPRLLAVPGAGGPRSPRAVAAALAQVMGRHDALRSLVRLGAEGPYQEVAAAGTLPIETVEVARDAADGAAADLVACLAGRSFGDGEQPLRAGLVVCDGAATHVALVLNHVVADWHAADVVVRAVGDAAPHTVPSAMFPEAAGAGATPRYARAVLSSPRLNRAGQVLARRAGVSTATVLLVAVAMLLRELTGHEVCAITPIVHNRFNDRSRDLVTSLNQLGLFTLGPCESLPETLVSAYPAVLASYRRARFDSLALNAMIDRMSADRGVPMFPSCCFNDLRPGEDPCVGGGADGESELECPRHRQAQLRLLRGPDALEGHARGGAERRHHPPARERDGRAAAPAGVLRGRRGSVALVAPPPDPDPVVGEGPAVGAPRASPLLTPPPHSRSRRAVPRRW